MEGQGMTLSVTSIQINPKLPDSLFAAPAGYRKAAMPVMPPGAVPAPSKHK
jgi:hypothetical protein